MSDETTVETPVTTEVNEVAEQVKEATPVQTPEVKDQDLFNKILDRFDQLDKKNEELLKRNTDYENQIKVLTEKLNKVDNLVKDNITEVMYEYDFNKEFDKIEENQGKEEEAKAREDFELLKKIFRKS